MTCTRCQRESADELCDGCVIADLNARWAEQRKQQIIAAWESRGEHVNRYLERRAG